jgi:capsular exopolysaccharide synthesis family protein
MDGKLNIKHIIRKLFSRWYYFLIALMITLPLAYAYVKLSPKQYVVKASVLLKSETQTGNLDSENILKGMNLYTSQTGIEDEIGILKSYTMVDRALRELDFAIEYYVRKNFVTSERYRDSPFTIEIDSVVNQIVNVPVFIQQISSTRYRVKVSAKNVNTYNYYTNQIEGFVDHIEIDEEVPLDKPFVNKYLSFKIKFNELFKVDNETETFFTLQKIQSLTEGYQDNLTIKPISPESFIVDLRVKGPVAEKEEIFINKLLEVYLKNELYKKNQLALKTIQFIDDQLNSFSDTLRQVEASVNTQRRFEFNDNVYNYLLERRAEAGIAIASNSVEKTVVDKPYQVGAGPVSPNDELIFALAIIVGIGCAVGSIVLKDMLNDNIVTHEDVEQHTKIPFIGTISHANKREQVSIIAHARSPIGESFRSLRVNLQYLTLGKNANVIGITSSRESEGKTFCSVNLAAVMAYSGRRTILLDTDMRRPRVAAYFQLKNRKGLSNFLVGDGTIKEIINNTEHKGFDVIGSGPIPPNPIDLIGSPRMEELINTLKQTYSTIILDSPPLGYVSEYIILMKYTDANLYIIRSDYTNRNSLNKINKLYERKKITNVSILLNDVKSTRSSGYGYGYGYEYGYKF